MSGRLALHGCRGCSAPRVFAARKRRQASSSCTRDGERNRQALAPTRWPAARSPCRSGEPAAVSVTTNVKSTGVDSGRRTWSLTGMMGTDMPPFRIARALFSGCAPACAADHRHGLCPTGARLLPDPGNPVQLGAVSSPEAAVSAVAQGRCAGVARPARVAGVHRRPDACGSRVPPGGGPGCDGVRICAQAATRFRRTLSAAAGGGRRCAYGSGTGAMVSRVASREAGSRCRKAEFWTP